MKKFIAAMAAICAIASCSSSKKTLDNSTFTITELNGTEYVQVSEETPSISFIDGTLSATVGGNIINANYKEVKDGGLELSYSLSTKMMVPEEYREDELVAAINSVVAYTLEDGTISLLDADGTAVIKATLVEE